MRKIVYPLGGGTYRELRGPLNEEAGLPLGLGHVEETEGMPVCGGLSIIEGAMWRQLRRPNVRRLIYHWDEGPWRELRGPLFEEAGLSLSKLCGENKGTPM